MACWENSSEAMDRAISPWNPIIRFVGMIWMNTGRSFRLAQICSRAAAWNTSRDQKYHTAWFWSALISTPP